MVASVLAVILLAATLFLQPPRAAVYWLANRSAPWLLTDFVTTPRGPSDVAVNGARKLVSSYLQHAAARAWRARLALPDGQNDADRLFSVLVPLRTVLLNQNEVPHQPAGWPVLLSGIGFCDQVNGVAALALTADFPQAQSFAIGDPRAGEHTIGRVWSPQRASWLYFDMWANVVVFELDPDGQPRVLASHNHFPLALDTSVTAGVARSYVFARSGKPLNVYRETFGAYVLGKAYRAVTARTLESVTPYATAASGDVVGLLGAAPPGAPSQRLAHPTPQSADYRTSFLKARLDQLYGDSIAARARFAQLAMSSGRERSALQSAARLFAERTSVATLGHAGPR